MPKRREQTTEPDEFQATSHSHKKHKKDKHKHKKKKKKDHRYDHPHYELSTSQASDTAGASDSAGKPLLKLKIKIGGKTFGTKKVDRITIPEPSSEEDDTFKPFKYDSTVDSAPAPVVETKVEKPPRKRGEDSDDEMWLKKLESGELDDKDDWRKKDPSLLTARQRAMLHGPNLDEEEKLVQLPSGYKTQEMTEEMIQRKAQKAKKRRQQAQKKIEENKKQTIDRLLKKQETKQKGTRGRPRRKPDIPKITYVNKLHSVSISLPAGVDFPLKRQTLVEPSKRRQVCGMTGCNNTKKYCCSKTGIPLCSLECYKKNIATIPCAS